MPGHANKKRPIDGRLQRPSKKQKRQQLKQYHSESEAEEEDQGFDPVNLLDSDDDIHNAKVDDGAEDAGDSDSSSAEEEQPKLKRAMKMKAQPKSKKAPPQEADEEDEDDDEEDEDEEDESNLDEFDLEARSAGTKSKAKRNDPTAFATSLSKILSTKLSSSKRSDPVLSRSAAAHEASKAAVDSALESKAKRQLKEQKRRALEKGRVKDVLIATASETTGVPETTTSEILDKEKKLRKVAQRGVVTLFNAVRAAQVKATEAEKSARKEGVIGIGQRESKVNELSKKGFLDLIASGGGGLKKGGLEEA
ncbi:pre-60S ribosomal particles component [Purpureocillium takamizusanense]|uniref:Pre-60S ribosomal particles component n=1 Tax=Purpureocillium takamizusanense TaxID=2060973 RepID=A0A9Q8QDH5_9HYPO|nr:pre-60S ribosomal particles component [Purpureocillium takamizusanense]UNI18744.1 pre-60S ribosomal particles component [Purpureocillium takamizusanense]